MVQWEYSACFYAVNSMCLRDFRINWLIKGLIEGASSYIFKSRVDEYFLEKTFNNNLVLLHNRSTSAGYPVLALLLFMMIYELLCLSIPDKPGGKRGSIYLGHSLAEK